MIDRIHVLVLFAMLAFAAVLVQLGMSRGRVYMQSADPFHGGGGLQIGSSIPCDDTWGVAVGQPRAQCFGITAVWSSEEWP